MSYYSQVVKAGKKAKLRIQIEFIPDEIRDSSDLDEFRDDVWPPIDPIT